jgi:uncharacterized protein YhfF
VPQLDISARSPGSYPHVTPYPKYISDHLARFSREQQSWLNKYGAVVDADLVETLEQVVSGNFVMLGSHLEQITKNVSPAFPFVTSFKFDQVMCQEYGTRLSNFVDAVERKLRDPISKFEPAYWHSAFLDVGYARRGGLPMLSSVLLNGGCRMQWRDLETFSFGDGPHLAERLGSLVLDGRKTATCWAVSEGVKKTEVGKLMVMLDGAGRPRAVIETVELTQRRFDEVDEQFANDEGEGDRTLPYWRAAHRNYFTRNSQFEDNMLLWCERFRVAQIISTD